MKPDDDYWYDQRSADMAFKLNRETAMTQWELQADVPVYTLQIAIQEYFPGQIAPVAQGAQWATVIDNGPASGPPEWMRRLEVEHPSWSVTISEA